MGQFVVFAGSNCNCSIVFFFLHLSGFDSMRKSDSCHARSYDTPCSWSCSVLASIRLIFIASFSCRRWWYLSMAKIVRSVGWLCDCVCGPKKYQVNGQSRTEMHRCVLNKQFFVLFCVHFASVACVLRCAPREPAFRSPPFCILWTEPAAKVRQRHMLKFKQSNCKDIIRH